MNDENELIQTQPSEKEEKPKFGFQMRWDKYVSSQTKLLQKKVDNLEERFRALIIFQKERIVKLENDVEFLKAALHRVLAEESARELEADGVVFG